MHGRGWAQTRSSRSAGVVVVRRIDQPLSFILLLMYYWQRSGGSQNRPAFVLDPPADVLVLSVPCVAAQTRQEQCTYITRDAHHPAYEGQNNPNLNEYVRAGK